MRAVTRALSLLLALALLAGAGLTGARADAFAEEVTISSAEELRALVKHCALDTWSQGRTVRLTADIDLSGQAFSPIPTFGGTFLGGGHTISGVNLTADGSNMGLFRFVQRGAIIQDLHVSGRVVPGGSRSNVGGVAGSNEGIILSCSFQGTVRGESAVGGIAGRNGPGGEIALCSAAGSVTGKNGTGGIAGSSYGLLLECESSASVNTTNPGPAAGLDSLTMEGALSQLTTPASDEESERPGGSHTDTGGIVGYSAGEVRGCSNAGAVGYSHVGYNVGGVAGRQAGYMAGCSNSAPVRGRKDVGGIVGQAEPDVELSAREDILSRLRRELGTLRGMIDRTLDHTDLSRADLSGRLEAMIRDADSARASAETLLDHAAGFVDGNIGAVNDLRAAVTAALEGLDPVWDDLEAVSGKLSALFDELEDAMSELQDGGWYGQAALDEAEDALSNLTLAAASLQKAAREVEEELNNFEGNPANLLELIPFIMNLFREDGPFAALTSPGGAFDMLSAAWGDLEDALRTLVPAIEELGGAADSLGNAAGLGSALGADMQKVLDAVQHVSARLAEDSAVEFMALGEAAREAGDALFDALSGLSGSMDALRAEADSAGDALSADFKAINRQMELVFLLVLDLLDDTQTAPEPSDLIGDVSDEAIDNARLGKAEGCINTGSVEGDRNVGGVVGTISIEYGTDPEDDNAGFAYGNYYELKAVLQNCVNLGPVTGRRDCVGGVAGRMDLGTVTGCENYGGVVSTGGSYVGGVAGYSDASVRSSWAKCSVSGEDYVGGVAGWAGRLTDCRALVVIEAGTQCVGSIAGGADVAGGGVRGNLFVDMGTAGVDGVSYTGIAEPVSYGGLLEEPGVPAGFTAFTLTLRAEGETVARFPFRYGEDLGGLALPEVPAREGFYGSWPEFDRSGTRSDITLDAVYTPWVTLVASERREGKLPLVLAEGQFTEDVSPQVLDSALAPPEGGEGGDWDIWEISLPGAGLTETDSVPLRLLNRGGGGAQVFQYVNGRWEEVEARANGQYLMLTMTGPAAVFCIRPVSGVSLLIPGLVAAAAGLCIILLIVHKRRAAKRKTSAPS